MRKNSTNNDPHIAQKFVWWLTGTGIICAGIWTVFVYFNDKPKTEIKTIAEQPQRVVVVLEKPVLIDSVETNPKNQNKTIMRDVISRNSVDENKISNKKQDKISKSRFKTVIRYPCLGNIDQILGVSLNHVHVTPSIASPSQPPVEGRAKVKINKTIYRDNKNWYEIIYVTNGQEYNGWLPTNYVLLSSDCYNN